MNEEQKVNEELNELAPEVTWPKVSMEVPDQYFQKSRMQLLKKHQAGNNRSARLRRIYIAIAATAAALIFLFIFTNVIQFSAIQGEPSPSDWEVAQYYLTEHIEEIPTEDLAYIFPEEEIIVAEIYELEESEWNKLIEDWTYEMDESTIQELKTELQ